MTAFDFDPVCGFVQMFRVKQSSLDNVNVSKKGIGNVPYLSLAIVPATFCGHDGPNVVAFTVPVPVKRLGAAKRSDPTGG
jgi:hypothetical protein